jgi:uncharacterized protein YbaR (Trm112 family)
MTEEVSALEREQERRETIQAVICASCGQFNREASESLPRLINHLYFTEYGHLLCPSCRRRYPLSLLKATADFFDYALKLRTGEIFYFSKATIHGEFVSLELQENQGGEQDKRPYGIPFARGVDVRASDIVWCADAPYGS